MSKTILLKADYRDVEGTIKVSEHFQSYETIVRLDILKDWRHKLELEYNATLIEFRKEFRKLRKNRKELIDSAFESLEEAEAYSESEA